MASERARSMVPALTFGTAKSRLEVKVGRRGKISLSGSGAFTPDELAAVVEQVSTWVRQLQQQTALDMTPPPSVPTYPPLPGDSPMDLIGSNDFQGGLSARDVVEPAARG